MPDGLDLDKVWSELPAAVQLEFTPGPQARGDLDAEARTLYVRVDGRPATTAGPPVARFADELTLLQAEIVEGTARLGAEAQILTLTWGASSSITEDLTVFVKANDSAGRELDTIDQPLGGPLFTTHRWPAGTQVREVYELPVIVEPGSPPLCFIVGVYRWPDLTRLQVVGADGTRLGDQVVISQAGTILNDSRCR